LRHNCKQCFCRNTCVAVILEGAQATEESLPQNTGFFAYAQNDKRNHALYVA